MSWKIYSFSSNNIEKIMVTIGNNKEDGLIDFGYSIDYTLRSLYLTFQQRTEVDVLDRLCNSRESQDDLGRVDQTEPGVCTDVQPD